MKFLLHSTKPSSVRFTWHVQYGQPAFLPISLVGPLRHCNHSPIQTIILHKPLAVLRFLLHVTQRFFSFFSWILFLDLHLCLAVDVWTVHYFVDPAFFCQGWCNNIFILFSKITEDHTTGQFSWHWKSFQHISVFPSCKHLEVYFFDTTIRLFEQYLHCNWSFVLTNFT